MIIWHRKTRELHSEFIPKIFTKNKQKATKLKNSRSQNSIIKEKKELFWAEIFINYINDFGEFDYNVEYFDSDTIDTKGISQSRKYQELNMQQTWVKEIEFNPSKPATNDLFFYKEKVKEAIERKTKDYTSRNKNFGNIILLLQGYMAHPWAKDILTEEFCKQYELNPFKGIYYLVRPSINSRGEEDPKNGSVLPIKFGWEKF